MTQSNQTEEIAVTLGEQLKKSRRDLKLSIDDVSLSSRIPSKYLYWLENGEYEKMPADVYVKGFISKYSKILNLNKEELIGVYLKEADVLNKIRSKKNVVPTLKYPTFVVTPRLIAIVVTILMVVAVIGYFGWQVYWLVRPPELVLDDPSNDTVTQSDNQIIKGSVVGANIFMINDKVVNMNDNGQFDEVVNLSEGLNVIELKAKSSFGKTTTLVRKIILNKE